MIRPAGAVAHQQPHQTSPETNLAWELNGTGYEHLGQAGQPVMQPVGPPAANQILVRIESVGVCYSDVKLLQQGDRHPKLRGRDLAEMPTRPGHEICFSIYEVGEDYEGKYEVGEQFVIQPEVRLGGKKRTYGFQIPGGLTQYQLLGPEILETDDGPSLIKIPDDLPSHEAALLEPWGSVISAYQPLRRLEPKPGGSMWVVGNPQSKKTFQISRFANRGVELVLSDLPNNQTMPEFRQSSLADGLEANEIFDFAHQFTGGEGFDDIVVLDPFSSERIQALIRSLAPHGLIIFVGQVPRGLKVEIDATRVHYDFISLVGNESGDIAASYGEDRNRSDLSEGALVLFGGAGPMGQMHIELALSRPAGPRKIVVLDINQRRLDHVQQRFEADAREKQIEFYVHNPGSKEEQIADWLEKNLGSRHVEDVVVFHPDAGLISSAASLLQVGSMLNLFAGTPANTNFNISLHLITQGNLQITGASGLSLETMREALRLWEEGKLDLSKSSAATCGLNAAAEAIRAAESRRFPGKVIVFPQQPDLPVSEQLN